MEEHEIQAFRLVIKGIRLGLIQNMPLESMGYFQLKAAEELAEVRD